MIKPVFISARYLAQIYWLLFLALLSWFGWEFIHTVKLTDIPWSRSGAANFGVFSAIVAGVFLVLRKFLAQNVLFGLIAVGMTVAVSAVGIGPVITVLTLLFSAKLLGKALVSNLGLGQQDLLHGLLQMSLGTGVYAVLIGLMVLMPINYPAVYFVLLIAPMLIWPAHAGTLAEESLEAMNHLNTYITREWFASLVVFYLLAIYFCVALLPEFGYDALAMHLTVPAYVAEHHRWGFEAEKYAWAVMPMNGDWLYTFAYMLGGEAAARLENLALSLMVTALLVSAVRIWVSPRMVLLSIVFFLSLPLTYLESSTLFIEDPWTVFLFAGTLCVLLFMQKGQGNHLLIASALLGIALGTKVIAVFLAVPLLLVTIFFLYRKPSFPQSGKLLVKCFVVFVALGSIPYVIAYVKTGNPVFPLYNAVFKSPFYDTATSFTQPIYNKGFHLLTLRDATFSSGGFIEGNAGSFGWIFFVILPLSLVAVIFSREKYATALAFVSVAFIALTFHSQSYLRYIFPAIPLLILIMLQGIESVRLRSERLGSTLILASWLLVGLNLLFLPSANPYYPGFETRALFSATARAEMIANRTPVRSAVEYTNANAGEGVRVGVFAPPFIAGLKGDPFLAHWYNYKFVTDTYKVATDDGAAFLLKEYRIDKIILDDGFNPGNGFPQITPSLKSATILEKQFGGGISVRTVKKDPDHSYELLKNSDLKETSGWSLTDIAQFHSKTHSLEVSASRIASQAVEVNPGNDYMLAASARCIRPGSSFRLQVNWLDNKGGMVGVHLTPVKCTDQFTMHSELVRAPENASQAIIYANGHSEGDRVEYNLISFKR